MHLAGMTLTKVHLATRLKRNMSELPEGIDPEIFEDLHTSLAGLSLCHVLHRPSELWEILQLVKTDRAMVRGEIYRYDGLRAAYRAAGIARTIVQKLDGIKDRTGSIIKSPSRRSASRNASWSAHRRWPASTTCRWATRRRPAA